jgi:acyl-CoA hydrolase
MASDYKTWHKHELGKRVVESLKHNFFDAYYFDDIEEAQLHIQQSILTGMNIAFGGSMTVRQMNLRNYANSIGATVIDHNAPGLSDEGKLIAMRQELTSDLFICSSNAITSSGYLVNVDGNGNRVAAMIFGPKKVIVVAGINKIVHSEQEAFKRLEFVAGPMNMKRLERRTPCGSDGKCHDCSSEDRGCRAYTVIRRRPALTPTEVIIIGDILGM